MESIEPETKSVTIRSLVRLFIKILVFGDEPKWNSFRVRRRPGPLRQHRVSNVPNVQGPANRTLSFFNQSLASLSDTFRNSLSLSLSSLWKQKEKKRCDLKEIFRKFDFGFDFHFKGVIGEKRKNLTFSPFQPRGEIWNFRPPPCLGNSVSGAGASRSVTCLFFSFPFHWWLNALVYWAFFSPLDVRFLRAWGLKMESKW